MLILTGMVVFWQKLSFAVCLDGGQVAWCGFWFKWLRWFLFQFVVGLGNERRGIVVLGPMGVLWLPVYYPQDPQHPSRPQPPQSQNTPHPDPYTTSHAKATQTKTTAKSTANFSTLPATVYSPTTSLAASEPQHPLPHLTALHQLAYPIKALPLAPELQYPSARSPNQQQIETKTTSTI